MPSLIEWTEETWNPTVGCSRVSPGCDHCYAIGVAHRAMQSAHEGLTIRRPGELPDWTGEVRCLPERLDVPLRRKKPTMYFVDSMSDLWHEGVSMVFQAQVFATMARSPQHTFQILTKRPQRMARVLRDWAYQFQNQMRTFGGAETFTYPLPNVWLGTSIESDRYVFRADHLRATPAAVRFLSLEPLLGPLPSLNLTETCPDCNGERLLLVPGGATSCERCFRGPLGAGESTGTIPRFDWVIVGGESGPGARPMHPDWVRDIRDRCVSAGIPFFFKQWGVWVAEGQSPVDAVMPSEAQVFGHKPPPLYKVGKKVAGRELDGRTWDEMPKSMEVA